MEKLTRTAYGALLESALYQRTPMVFDENTTLNEKFGILPGVYPAASEYTAARYFAIGVGGHTFSIGANGMPKMEIYQHQPTDAALFQHIPFIMRELTNDLDVTMRGSYALRRIEQHNNVQYVCYYLKRLDMTGVSPQLIYKTVNSAGDTVATPWTPDSSVLNPKPAPLSDTGVNVTSGDYIAATALNQIKFTTAELEELKNVGNILFGDPAYLIISEMALVAAIDRQIPVTSVGNSTFNFNEVIGAQVVNFVGTAYPIEMINAGIEIDLDVGATEPLISLQAG